MLNQNYVRVETPEERNVREFIKKDDVPSKSAFDLYDEYISEVELLSAISVCPECRKQGTGLPVEIDTYKVGCSHCGHTWELKAGTFEDNYLNGVSSAQHRKVY